MTNRSMLPALLCGIALFGAGCGDDDNKALSYDETGTEIGKICDSVSGSGLTGDPANDAPILESVIGQFEKAVEDVRDLDVNEELEAARDDFADNGERQIAILKEAQKLAEEGDKKAYQAKLDEGGALDTESDEIASDLGAENCIS